MTVIYQAPGWLAECSGLVGFGTGRAVHSWFAIDLLSCIPVQHITRALEGADGEVDVRFLKVIRLLRLGKMLRLARMARIMQKYEDLEVILRLWGDIRLSPQ